MRKIVQIANFRSKTTFFASHPLGLRSFFLLSNSASIKFPTVLKRAKILFTYHIQCVNIPAQIALQNVLVRELRIVALKHFRMF